MDISHGNKKAIVADAPFVTVHLFSPLVRVLNLEMIRRGSQNTIDKKHTNKVSLSPGAMLYRSVALRQLQVTYGIRRSRAWDT